MLKASGRRDERISREGLRWEGKNPKKDPARNVVL